MITGGSGDVHSVDHLAMKRIRPTTVLLLVLILALGYHLATGQRREARLRAALALYKGRATGDLVEIMGRSVPMDWPEGTPLGAAIEQVKDSAPDSWGFPRGLPIVVDPDGLREAGRSLTSPMAAPPYDPIAKPLPLRQKLRMILEPLGLAAEVRDGAIVITARNRVDEPSTAAEEE
jgi:hypothetical protein